MTEYKTCSICKQEYPATAENFPFEKRNADGFKTWCRVCDRAKRKKSRQDNPERIKAEKQRYHAKHRDQDLARSRRWEVDNADHAKELKRIYYLEHRDVIIARSKAVYARDPEARKAYIHQWQKEHPEKRRQYGIKQRRSKGMKPRPTARFHNERRRVRKALYKARVLGLPATLTYDQWEACLNYFDHRCAFCGRVKSIFHVISLEHWIPLSKGGGTTADNVFPTCVGSDGCNNKKTGRDPIDFLSLEFPDTAQDILSRILAYFASLPTA